MGGEVGTEHSHSAGGDGSTTGAGADWNRGKQYRLESVNIGLGDDEADRAWPRTTPDTVLGEGADLMAAALDGRGTDLLDPGVVIL